MFDLLTGILTAASIAGVILNIRRLRSSFYIWSVTNLSWAAVDFYREIYAQAVLFLIYFALAIYGIWAWKRPVDNSDLRG